MRIDVRGQHVDLQPALGAYAERRLLTALKRFAARIPTVTVRLIDDNGPKKGIDKRCQVAVTLSRVQKPILIEEHDADPYKAIDAAADRVSRAVTRLLGRRRAGRAFAAERREGERTGFVAARLVPVP
jgi:ribosomal subunit interface protein